MRDKARPRVAVVWETTGAVAALMIDWFDTEQEAMKFARGKSLGAKAPVYLLWGDKVFDPEDAP